MAHHDAGHAVRVGRGRVDAAIECASRLITRLRHQIAHGWTPIPVRIAEVEDWHAEYLELILACRVVEDMDAAIDHINRYGSLHTEAIVTSDYGRAHRFIREVNSSCVLVNASTRFADGGQLGLGAEIGISTTKLHSFGPMGLTDLTTTKFIVYGDGQVRP